MSGRIITLFGEEIIPEEQKPAAKARGRKKSVKENAEDAVPTQPETEAGPAEPEAVVIPEPIAELPVPTSEPAKPKRARRAATEDLLDPTIMAEASLFGLFADAPEPAKIAADIQQSAAKVEAAVPDLFSTMAEPGSAKAEAAEPVFPQEAVVEQVAVEEIPPQNIVEAAEEVTIPEAATEIELTIEEPVTVTEVVAEEPQMEFLVEDVVFQGGTHTIETLVEAIEPEMSSVLAEDLAEVSAVEDTVAVAEDSVESPVLAAEPEVPAASEEIVEESATVITEPLAAIIEEQPGPAAEAGPVIETEATSVVVSEVVTGAEPQPVTMVAEAVVVPAPSAPVMEPATPQPEVVVTKKKRTRKVAVEPNDEADGETPAVSNNLPMDWEGHKTYYTIGEVAALFKVKTSHIRFWTNEFKLKVRTTRKGDRLYTPELVKEVRAIYHLVKERGFTLAGAKARLKSQNKKDVETVDLKHSLQQLRSQLVAIKNQL